VPPFAFIVFLEENNFTTKGTPPPHSSYTRYHHNSGGKPDISTKKTKQKEFSVCTQMGVIVTHSMR